MESWRRQYLGLESVPAALTSAEIEFFFAPGEQARWLIGNRRRPLTRLGLILQIGFLRMTGRPLALFERLPAAVLACAAAHAGMSAPRIATLRSIYRRRMTLFQHQRIAAEAIGFRVLGEHATRKLTAHLRRQATIQLERDDLVQDARIWLYDRQYVLPGIRPLEEMAAAAQLNALEALASSIRNAVGPDVSAAWADQLSDRGPGSGGSSLLDWLRAAPSGYGRKEIADIQDRIAMLRRLGADRIALPDLTIDRMRQHSRGIARRKAATLSRLREPRRTVEIGCWLRLQLLELTDTVLEQANRRIGQLWGQARRVVEERALEELNRYRVGVVTIIGALDDPCLPENALRSAIERAVGPFRSMPTSGGRIQAIRAEMAAAPKRLRMLLRQVGELDLVVPDDHPLRDALGTLSVVYRTGTTGLARWENNPFPPTSARTITGAGTDEARLAAYEVATAMLLKRSLRNGSVSAPHSIRHRSVDDQLMPAEVWAAVRGTTARRHGWPASLEAYLRRFEEPLSLRMEMLQEAIAAGEIGVTGDRFQVPKLQAVPKDPAVDETRLRLFQAIGSAQLPDVIVETDARIGFSTTLLGRPARNPDELEALYAGVLALGTEKTASDMARMVDGISDDRIELAMRGIEEGGRLRAACDQVAADMLAQPVARMWGSGVAASADMMSLDATRHLWTARIEPRRRTPAIGTYTHVSNRWAIVYDQPIVLNQRQAGAAIEGALQQKVADLQRLAVDTHGFTHFALATAKLLGFDLSPRLADIASRKLYLPASVRVPEQLEPRVEHIKPGRQARKGWDGLLRMVTSLEADYGSPATVIERHGSAAQGTPVYECGTYLGKVLRSLFLLDYLIKPGFRREVHRLLSQGESVHLLQRALMAGRIEAKHGRTLVEGSAISGALTLLTNIVMAWNTNAMQTVIDGSPAGTLPEPHLAHIAPVAHRHINMNGRIRFAIEEYGRLVHAGGRKNRNGL
ncbi:MAG: Tn3 family transposase [Alphaproteobacteria bacterium]|nr:Tn3 family transposase [Alphaproteobacteria bacterium]